jgi:hypothetical protein
MYKIHEAEYTCQKDRFHHLLDFIYPQTYPPPLTIRVIAKIGMTR